VTDDIRIDDLANPVLNDLQRAAIEYGDSQHTELTIDAVRAAATARTGLDDFGPDDFVERLGVQLDEMNADEERTGIGRMMMFGDCTRYAANRLLIQRYWSEYPESLDVTIDRPIDVVALPRSGSTHLENLVGADRRLRHLPVYVAAQPAPAPAQESGDDRVDPRWTRAEARWELMSQNEVMAAMHEHSPDHACGENELQIPDFASYQWEWMAHVPRFRTSTTQRTRPRTTGTCATCSRSSRISSRVLRGGCSSRTSTASSSARCSRPIPTPPS